MQLLFSGEVRPFLCYKLHLHGISASLVALVCITAQVPTEEKVELMLLGSTGYETYCKGFFKGDLLLFLSEFVAVSLFPP